MICQGLGDGGPMRYDEAKIDEAALAVLYLTSATARTRARCCGKAVLPGAGRMMVSFGLL